MDLQARPESISFNLQGILDYRRGWTIYQPNQDLVGLGKLKTEDRELADRFIDSTKSFLHPDYASESDKVRQVERRTFKIHLKLPLEKKSQVLELLKSKAFELGCPTFKVYEDSTEIKDARSNPTDPIASMVFYFEGAGDKSPSEIAKASVEFAKRLSDALKDITKDIYAQPIPRFSFSLPFADHYMSLTQGDADFKLRCFWPPISQPSDTNPFKSDSNNAFFKEDNESILRIIDNAV